MRSQVLAVILAIIVAASASVGYFAGVSNRTTVTSVLTLTTTSTQTTKSIVGAASQCGFASTCNAFNSAGLELSLSVNSTSIRPNGTFTLNVTEFNPLPVTIHISSSEHWPIDGLLWGCGNRYYFPDGIAVFIGYYSLNNITAATALNIWPPIPCAAEFLFNGTSNIVGILQRVASYSFMPKSFNANYSAYYLPNTGLVTLGTFLPTRMVNGATITATYYTDSPPYVVALGSNTPGVYTLVAGDEWGDLVLLHLNIS